MIIPLMISPPPSWYPAVSYLAAGALLLAGAWLLLAVAGVKLARVRGVAGWLMSSWRCCY